MDTDDAVNLLVLSERIDASNEAHEQYLHSFLEIIDSQDRVSSENKKIISNIEELHEDIKTNNKTHHEILQNILKAVNEKTIENEIIPLKEFEKYKIIVKTILSTLGFIIVVLCNLTQMGIIKVDYFPK